MCYPLQGVPINMGIKNKFKIIFVRISGVLPNFNGQNKVTFVKP